MTVAWEKGRKLRPRHATENNKKENSKIEMKKKVHSINLMISVFVWRDEYTCEGRREGKSKQKQR